MRINVLGGGPAGLYFSLLMKGQDASHEITIYERDGPHDTFGWGIVFSDQTFDYLRDSDRPSYDAIVARCQKWDNVDVVHRGERITVGGNRFSGIARIAFLRILQERCRALNVGLRHHTPVADSAPLAECDLLVGADGANSLVRRTHADVFRPDIRFGLNKYIWLGTRRLFHGLTLTFVDHATGAYAGHSYRFDDTTSTFIVECGEDTWRRAGFDLMTGEEACRALELVFEPHLQGEPLLTNNFVKWLNFPLVHNERWYGERLVLLGDALHTAHFSIGSGTKLALEDAIALSRALAAEPDPAAALPLFERMRRPKVQELQQAAVESLRWFEHMADYMHLAPLPLAMEAMTRSRKIDLEKLRRRDPGFVAAFERWSEQAAGR